jgi:hypothetical protein
MILLVSLIGAILVYSSIINDRDRRISELNGQITSRDSIISSLNLQVADLASIANLAKSATWVNLKTVSIEAGYEIAWNVTANYAGYVSVMVSSSTTGNIYVRVAYSSSGVDYESQMSLGGSGTAVFPVLPALIQISVGNPSTAVASATVTIIYHY